MSNRTVIKGLDALLDKLDELEEMEQDEALELGLARGAAKGIQRAQRLVPVQSGDLRDSLHVGGYTKLTPGYRKVGAYGALKGPGGRGKARWVLAGSTLPYAGRVEKGTKFARPHPYLRPAIDGAQGEIVKECDRAVQEIIDR